MIVKKYITLLSEGLCVLCRMEMVWRYVKGKYIANFRKRKDLGEI